MNQMGNLEKLGILVIVILVVVVGVVAITPKDQVETALFPAEEQTPAAPIDPVAPAGETPADWPKALDPAPKQAPIGVDPTIPGQVPAQLSGDKLAGGTGTGTGTQIGAGTPPAPAPSATEYVVKKGDTGDKIAKATGVAWSKISAANGNQDARRLKINQKLVIPANDGGAVPAPMAGGTAATPPMPLAQTPAPQTPGQEPFPITPTPAPAPAAEERTYVVQRGDTLSDIARRELGSASKWTLLRDANTDVLRGGDAVRPGMKLRIPSVARAATPAPAPGQAAATAGSGAKTYRVKRGDSLISIASRTLGSGSRWKELQRANEGILHGSTNVREGMELTIPDDVSAR